MNDASSLREESTGQLLKQLADETSALVRQEVELAKAELAQQGKHAAIAGVLALAGRGRLKQATPPAPQTVETLKEDVEWAKTQTGSASR